MFCRMLTLVKNSFFLLMLPVQLPDGTGVVGQKGTIQSRECFRSLGCLQWSSAMRIVYKLVVFSVTYIFANSSPWPLQTVPKFRTSENSESHIPVNLFIYSLIYLFILSFIYLFISFSWSSLGAVKPCLSFCRHSHELIFSIRQGFLERSIVHLLSFLCTFDTNLNKLYVYI